MKLATSSPSATRAHLGTATGASVIMLLLAGLLVALGGSAQAAATAVPLGTADSFVVLAGAGVTNTGPTTLNGDIGTFPTTSITGTRSLVINGVNHGGGRRDPGCEGRPENRLQCGRR